MSNLKKLFSDLGILMIISFCLYLYPNALLSQEMNRVEIAYSWFDDMIGKSNTGIYKGNEYVEEYHMTNESHKYFKKANFLIGSVTYDNQNYFYLELRYDVFGDQLHLRNSDVLNSPVIVLNKTNITKFTIDGHEFNNKQIKTDNKTSLSGFFEVILTTKPLVLYKKHKKKISKTTKNNLRYDSFKNLNQYYISYGGNYFRISKTYDLNKIFPNYKSQLKNITDQYASLKKADSDNYIKSILMDLSKSMVDENNIGL